MAEEIAAASAPEETLFEEEKKPKRSYFTLSEKIDICIEGERRVYAEKSISLKAYCREKSVDGEIQPSQYRRWRNNLTNMKKTLDNTKRKKSKLVATTGRKSQLWKIKDRLFPWIRAMRSAGKRVTVRMTAMRCRKYLPAVRRMKRYTLFQSVRRFLDANRVVMRAVTHKAQDNPEYRKDTATGFLQTTIPLLKQPNRDKRFIINMDQTPYNPQDVPDRTLDFKGAKTVAAKALKTSVGRVSVLLTVTASGDKLPPMLVYKAVPGKTVDAEVRAMAREVNKDNKDKIPIVCTVQQNAWTDERIMLMWVDLVLNPYVKKVPPGVVPYLFLDKYGCHYQGSVAKEIEKLGVEWDIIPGGCTGLIQPIDVGVGKPFKNRMRYKWEDWQMDQMDDDNGIQDRIVPKKTRRLIGEWALEAWNRIPREVIYNSWRHRPFSYFPDEDTLTTDFQEEEDEYEEGDMEIEIIGESSEV